MPQKILVAEDELDIRDLVKIKLEKNNYQLTVAANGVEALEIAESELPTHSSRRRYACEERLGGLQNFGV